MKRSVLLVALLLVGCRSPAASVESKLVGAWHTRVIVLGPVDGTMTLRPDHTSSITSQFGSEPGTWEYRDGKLILDGANVQKRAEAEVAFSADGNRLTLTYIENGKPARALTYERLVKP